MEAYIDFFNIYVMGIVQMLTGFHFFTGFLKRKVKPVYYAVFAVFGLVATWVLRTGGGIGMGNSRLADFFVYILLLVAFGIFLCRAEIVSVVLYAALVVEIMQLCYGVFNSALSILMSLAEPYHSKIIGIAFMVLGNMAIPLAVFCYFIIHRCFLYDEMVKGSYVFLILTPTLMIFLMGEYINSVIYGSIGELDGDKVIGNAEHCRMLIIQLLGMASMFCIMFAYKKLLENFRLSKELSLLEQEEYFLNQYVEEAKTRYEKTRSFRHDIKNHITVVRELIQDGKYGEAQSYIGDMEDMSGGLSFPCSTNNPVTDILVGNKLGIARSKGIDVQCTLALPYPCGVRDIDFCIILSNALDNAICACGDIEEGKEKYIRLTGKIQGDFVLLEVRNTCKGKSLYERGTGLSNIEAVAQRYHGAMSVNVGDTEFALSVLLIIPQHGESIPQQIG